MINDNIEMISDGQQLTENAVKITCIKFLSRETCSSFWYKILKCVTPHPYEAYLKMLLQQEHQWKEQQDKYRYGINF